MNHKSELLKYPSKTDWNDPLYCKKFAHCMPPLIAYRCRPANLDKQNVQGDDNCRKVYYGWNNYSEYEKTGIQNVKKWLKEQKKRDVRPGFSDQNLLKFVQAEFFNIAKAGEKLNTHFDWLDSLPIEPKLTEKTLKLL